MNPIKQPLFKQLLIVVAALAVIGGAFGAGYHFGTKSDSALSKITTLTNLETGKPDQTDFSLFWQAWNTLNDKFVGSTTPADKDKVFGAVKGLAASFGDPYTTFFPPVQSKDFADAVAGSFAGVGMEVGAKDGQLVVVSPLKDTPAMRGGVKAGDKILKIDKTDSSTMAVDAAVQLIRGAKGTKVALTLGREGVKDPIVVSLIRDDIPIPTVDTELRKDSVFVIRLYSFSATSPDLFRKALRDFVASGSNRLILDLRNNPGGYLEAAVDMASWFLPTGDVVVTEDYGKNKTADVYRSKGYNVFNENLKMAILINGGSASASEILAGALHDHGKATLIGEKSFGKGSVQELVQLPENTSLKVTIARWLTPKGTWISGVGISPDVPVKISDDDVKAMRDSQMEKAAAVLLAK